MQAQEKHQPITTRDFLVENDIKPSYQRMAIYEFLDKPMTHMTADQIYKELNQSIPTLSKTTVYNTLKLMAEKGIVRELAMDDHESRFEVATTPHGHFKCNCCGELYDFSLEDAILDTQDLADFNVEHKVVMFFGTCPKCKDSV